MTNNEAPQTSAGWYPDPDGAPRQRFWDGGRWTDDVAPASAPPYSGMRPQLTAPEGTDWKTPWIWLVIVLPLLPLIPLLFLDWMAFFAFDPDSPESALESQLALITSPAYLAGTLGSWLAWALSVLCAFLDFRALRDRGVPSPFHWAWAFLGSVVYAIGRGVVVQRRTGRGIVVVWLTVASIVLSFVFVGVLVATILNTAISQVPLD